MRTREKRTASKETGFALVMVLILTTLLAAAGITLNRVGGLNTVIEAGREKGDQAYYVADACVQAALYALKGNPALRGSIINGAAFGPGSCSVVVTDSPSPQGDILITSTGMVGTATRTIEKRYFPPAFESVPPLQNDTYLSEWDWSKNYGISTRLKIGAKEIHRATRGLIKFDLNSIPAGAVVFFAKLELYLYDHSRKVSAGNHIEIEVHRLLHTWKEGSQDGRDMEANWRQYDKKKDWLNRGGDFDSNVEAMTQIFYDDIDQWIEWDITTLAQFWVDNPTLNFGMLLKDDYEGTEGGDQAKKEIFEARFYSSEYLDFNSRPKLTVIYGTP